MTRTILTGLAVAAAVSMTAIMPASAGDIPLAAKTHRQGVALLLPAIQAAREAPRRNTNQARARVQGQRVSARVRTARGGGNGR